MKQKWSYKVISIKPEIFGPNPVKFEQELNKLGAEGWELVAAQQNGITTLLYLKKET